jgi:glycine/D-amino acid oxidase-like deaminating enzyme
VLTNCAVRSLDLEAGRVSGVVTESGRIKAQAVVCAGGIWSSLFNGNAGIRLPQLKVKNSVLRTAPAPAVTEGAVWSSEFGLRRRQDGGYTIAHGSRTDFDLVPDAFRYFREFVPAWRMERKHIRIRLGTRSVEEMRTPRRWRADQKSPFEFTRVMDPLPNTATLELAVAGVGRRFPTLSNVQPVESWAGLIDVTPDAVPVISPVEPIPGYFLATGFSGHGFGIGPGAGKLAAEMIMGNCDAEDLEAFRYSRFIDGTRLAPSGAI